MAAILSSSVSCTQSPWMMMSSRNLQTGGGPTACLSLSSGSRPRSNLTMKVTSSNSGLLRSSFLSTSLYLLSSFSGLSLGLSLNSDAGVRKERGYGLVVRAGKAALCQTRRNRSRKSLARTHGFCRRMRTTSGRAVLKRRRAKGRWVLCPKSNPNSGKRA